MKERTLKSRTVVARIGLAALAVSTVGLTTMTPVPTRAAQSADAGCEGALDILLTNDDGWSAPGLQAVRSALIAAGHTVTVVAPLANQSGKGGAITTGGTLTIQRQVDDGANDQWSVAGTPADSVRVGLDVILADDLPDLVVSGANFGENISRGIASGSGTVGAAYAATNNRTGSIPAIDVSVQLKLSEAPGFQSTLDAFPEAAAFTARLVGDLQDDCTGGRLLPEYQQLHVNYPARPASQITGVEVARLASTAPLDIALTDPQGAVAAGGGELRVGFQLADPATLDGEGRALADGRIAIVVFDGDMSAPTDETKRLGIRIDSLTP